MSGPSVIYLDPRVLASMKTEPDEDAAVEPVPYYSNEYTRALVDASRGGGDEFFIQILIDPRTNELIGLTNYGRIFARNSDSLSWLEIAGPVREDLAP